MAKEQQNFVWYSGDDRILRISVTDKYTKDKINLTDFDITWTLHLDSTSSAILTKTSEAQGGISKIEPLSNGIFEVSLDSTDNAPENGTPLSGDYFHKCKLEDALGRVTTILIGNVHIE